jgi:hypothetical protein
MKTIMGAAVTGVAVFVAAESLWAHHSFLAVFDGSKTLALTGTITKLDWRNPHIELWLDVKDDRGQPESWVIEGGPPNFFARQHIGKSDFEHAFGQPVTVEIYRARDGTLMGYLRKLTFPDGKFLKGDA